MPIREYAKSRGFEVIGKLKRASDFQPDENERYPVWEDEAGNAYIGSYKDKDYCIVTFDGAVL